MKKVLLLAILGLMISFSAKSQITYLSDNGAGDTLYQVSGTLVGTGTGLYKNIYFQKHNQYLLTGYVFVDSLSILNIPAGTVIKGDKVTKGTLIIKRGAKIKALGTNTDPIIFTSAQPIGQRAAGDWGGLVICGSARNNIGTNVQLEGNYGAFHGGTNDADNSGTIKFVRIEFGGIALNPNQEINSLTLGSVGSGTVLHHIQVSYAGDDSYEWFGGKVNSRYLIAYNGVDDDFDTDNGFSGFNQWGIGLHNDPNIADVSKTNGFESDNNSSSSSATPKTTAVFTNYAMFGPSAPGVTTINSNFQAGAHIRRNSELGIYNSMFANWPKGLIVDGATTIANAQNGLLEFRNNAMANNVTTYNEVGGTLTPSISAWADAQFDTTYATYAELKYQNPYGVAPAVRNFATKYNQSPLRYGASFSSSRLALPTGSAGAGFSNTVVYRALGGNWAGNPTLTWFNYDPQNADYTLGNYATYAPTETGDVNAQVALRSAEAATSIESNFETIAIFPNPADVSTMMSIEFAEAGEGVINVYNVSGQLVHTARINFINGLNEFFFDSSVLENGLYIVSATCGAESKTATMMVNHN
jgi:hypothetical protein